MFSLNHDLVSVLDIHALARRHFVELHAIEGVGCKDGASRMQSSSLELQRKAGKLAGAPQTPTEGWDDSREPREKEILAGKLAGAPRDVFFMF